MADKWPLANGNWSNAANWNDGTKPVAGDDVYADGKIITINESVTVASIRTTQRSGGTNGGYFIINSSITINANIINTNINSSPCLYFTAGTLTINGNLTGGGSSNAYALSMDVSAGSVTVNGNVTGGYNGTLAACIFNNTNSTININGNVTGGTQSGSVSSAAGVYNNLNGAVNITGNVTGGTGNTNAGVQNQANGTITINGNVSGGGSSNGCGIINQSTGSVTIIGNVTGGFGTGSIGAVNNGTATMIITGSCTGGSGSGAHGASNNSTGILRVYGIAIGNDHGLGYASNNGTVGVSGFGTNAGANQATTTVRGIRYGAKGQSPTAGLVQLDTTDLANSYAKFRTAPTSFTEYTFGPPENIGGQPAASNVRLGTVYNFGNTTGTCAVPPSGSVALGVPVDNGSGTAILTASDFTAILSANLQPNGPIVVERSKEDTNGITFSWPALGATITGQVSKNNGAYAATAGAISFLRTDGTRYYYTLAYNAADRPPAEGTARYRLTDGTYTKYFTLRVEPSYVANVSVTPGFALQQDPATKQDLLIYTDEEDNFTVDIFRQDGFTPVNLSGMNLQFKVSDLNDQLLYTIGSGNITIGGVDNNQITFPKASLTSNDFEGKWGLRDAANGDKVIAYGRIEILYVP